MTHDELEKQVREILESIPDDLQVLEQGINSKTQDEYFSLSAKIEKTNDSEQDLINKADTNLFDNTVSADLKKEYLIRLANLGTIPAYRLIEKYLKNNHDHLKDWAVLALRECRMILEYVLLDEEQGFISTPLGGKGNMLRYYIVISARNKFYFNENQQDIITEGFEKTAGDLNSEIEEYNFNKNHCLIKLLLSNYVALDELVLSSIKTCNQSEDFIRIHYMATNQKKPTEQEIKSYLEYLEK